MAETRICSWCQHGRWRGFLIACDLIDDLVEPTTPACGEFVPHDNKEHT